MLRVLSFLLTFLIFCQSGFASGQPTNNLRSMEEADPLFQPVPGMYAGLDEAHLIEIEKKKVFEVNTFQKLIGDAKVEEVADLLKEAKTEKRAGCILGWSAKGLSAVTGITIALNTALGGPPWVSYVTAATAGTAAVLTHLAEYFKDDANSTKKKVIQCHAAALKELSQIQEARRAKKDLDAAKNDTKMLATEVDNIHRLLTTNPRDTVLNMDGDSEEAAEDAAEEEGSKQKEEVTDSKPKRRKGKLVKRPKANVTPKPPANAKTPGQEAAMVPVATGDTTNKPGEVIK